MIKFCGTGIQPPAAAPGGPMRIASPARSDARSDCWPRKPDFGGAGPLCRVPAQG